MQDTFRYLDEHRDRTLEELFALVRQPSISAQDIGVAKCAELLAGMMRAAGIETTVFKTPGHPVVYGEVPCPDSERTLLLYGHYDVQPPEPLDQWKSPPFEPTIRDGRIYGRGTADDKGQLLAHVKATQAFLQTRGKLPINVKFLFEGEEEISSRNLRPFVEAHRDLLKADAVLTADGPGHESGRPVVNCGLKGMSYVEIRAKGANRDLHSMRAAMVPSPAWKLVHALASLKDRDGRIRIPGFYDSVRPLRPAEVEAARAIPNDAPAVRAGLEVDELIGGDMMYYHNMAFATTCNLAGLTSGYQGPGKKTVLPCRASAKVDFRLVPDQTPREILEKLRAHLSACGFEDLEVEFLGGVNPSRTPVDHPYVQTVARAIRKATGQEPILSPSMGGSGPDWLFTGLLGLPSVWLPFSPHDSYNHAPNESTSLDDFFRGIKISTAIMEEMGGGR